MLENRTLEIIIIAVVVLLLFGAKRLPDSARALGKSLRIFKSEVGAMKSDAKAGSLSTTVITPTAEEATQLQALAPVTGEAAEGLGVSANEPLVMKRGG